MVGGESIARCSWEPAARWYKSKRISDTKFDASISRARVERRGRWIVESVVGRATYTGRGDVAATRPLQWQRGSDGHGGGLNDRLNK